MIYYQVSCTPQDVKREKEMFKKYYKRELTASKENMQLLFEDLCFARHCPPQAAMIYVEKLKSQL